MKILPSPRSELRELLHSHHTETHQVIAESRREIFQRLRFVRHLLIELEDATKQKAKEKKKGLTFLNVPDRLLEDLLAATMIHTQAVFREVARVNKVVKESMSLPDGESKQSEDG